MSTKGVRSAVLIAKAAGDEVLLLVERTERREEREREKKKERETELSWKGRLSPSLSLSLPPPPSLYVVLSTV